jgi:hypothetical protein
MLGARASLWQSRRGKAIASGALSWAAPVGDTVGTEAKHD